MLSPADIRPAVEAVLLTASSGLTTYEILDQLPAALRQQIIAERGMPGLGSGNSYSAASLVTDAVEGVLPSLDPPYRVYVHGQAVFTVAGEEIRPGNSAIALYRLNPPVASRSLVSESENEAAPVVTAVATPFSSPLPTQSNKQEWFERSGMLVLWFVLFWPVFLVGMYYNGKAAITKGRTPWYEETPWLVLSALFFPLFFVGLFSSRKIRPKWKWTVAGSFILLYGVFVLTYRPDAGNSNPAPNVDVSRKVADSPSPVTVTPSRSAPTADQIKAQKEREQRLAIAQAKAERQAKRHREAVEKLEQERAERELDQDGMVLMLKSVKGEKDGEYASISGVVENRTLQDWSYAQISFNLYDRNGDQCGSAMANIVNVKYPDRWRFKATGMGQAWQTYKFGSMIYR
jgi:hypothetical protein